MNPLAVQRQLLVAESELNRAQMVGDLTRLSADVRSLADRTTAISSVLSYARVLVAGLEAIRGRNPPQETQKRSWWQSIRGGADLAIALWRSLRSRAQPPSPG